MTPTRHSRHRLTDRGPSNVWLDQSGHGGLADLRVHLAVSTGGLGRVLGETQRRAALAFGPNHAARGTVKSSEMQVCTSTGEPLHLEQHVHCLIPTLVLPTASTFFRKYIEGEETMKNNSCQPTQNFKVSRGKKQAPLVSIENLLTPQTHFHSFPFSFLTKITSHFWCQPRWSRSTPSHPSTDHSWKPRQNPNRVSGDPET